MKIFSSTHSYMPLLFAVLIFSLVFLSRLSYLLKTSHCGNKRPNGKDPGCYLSQNQHQRDVIWEWLRTLVLSRIQRGSDPAGAKKKKSNRIAHYKLYDLQQLNFLSLSFLICKIWEQHTPQRMVAMST